MKNTRQPHRELQGYGGSYSSNPADEDMGLQLENRRALRVKFCIKRCVAQTATWRALLHRKTKCNTDSANVIMPAHLKVVEWNNTHKNKYTRNNTLR